MDSGFFRAMAVAAIGLAVASCATPVSTAESSPPQPHVSVPHIVEGCGDDDTGTSRHFGTPTPFSDNPFLNPCWPE